MSSNTNFKKAFQEDFELTMVQVAQSMFDKYYTKAYIMGQVYAIDDMILSATNGCSVANKRKDLRKKCWDKQGWMCQMKVVMRELLLKVRTRKCNDCKKMWYECRNTCIKPKTNPRPIEFPQDVFNVIKDYMDIVDVPTPVWNEMMSKSIKEISTHRKYKGTGPDYYKPFPEGTNLRKVKVAEKNQRYWVGVIQKAKNHIKNKRYPHMKYRGTYNEEELHFYGRHWCQKTEGKWGHPALEAYVGFEATNHTMMVNSQLKEYSNHMIKLLYECKPCMLV